MANFFKNELNGYCDYCNKPTLSSADFCHHCGKRLTIHTASKAPEENPISPSELSTLLKETNNLFLVWICGIMLLGGAALAYHLAHTISAIIISGVVFLYAHIFFTTKLDELSIATRHSPQQIAFFSLLLPIVGTLLCYQRLAQLASLELKAEVDTVTGKVVETEEKV